MRVALTAGGTGGHIIPALTVLDVLVEREPELEAAFFGPDDRGERDLMVGRVLAFHRVPAAGLRGRAPWRMAAGLFRIARGVLGAARALRRFRPDVVFSTGGYGSFPASFAARLLRYPLVVFLPDVEPGWAVRIEKRLATRVATTTEAALTHLPRKRTVVTGYPVRPAFFALDRQVARTQLGLAEDDLVLLVAGASQGARAINTPIFAALDDLLADTQLFHVTGPADAARAEELRSALEPGARERYHPAPFRDDLPLLMHASDLAVMRAGASVLGELPAAGLPAVLIPGTFAGGHQRENARWLADNGAAEVLEEGRAGEIVTVVRRLLADPDALSRMREQARALARPAAAADIATQVMEAAR